MYMSTVGQRQAEAGRQTEARRQRLEAGQRRQMQLGGGVNPVGE